jgi:hypothetical protein
MKVSIKEEAAKHSGNDKGVTRGLAEKNEISIVMGESLPQSAA